MRKRSMENCNDPKNISDLSHLATEAANPCSQGLDQMSIEQIVTLINQEDRKIIDAVAHESNIIAQVIHEVVRSFENNGRLFLCGAGTSGRLAVMEASECPPTFSTPPTLIQGVMAGAPQAFFQAVEGAEDDPIAGMNSAKDRAVCKNDFALGISASGRTPYVVAFLDYARSVGAKTALLCASTPNSPQVDFVISPPTGPEVLSGSTRMKAATAAKMILNMITTTAMVSLGKVYDHWMVDVHPNSAKLIDRAARIVVQVTGCSKEQAVNLIQSCGNAKVAIVMYVKNVNAITAQRLLEQHHGKLRDVLNS